MMKQLTFEKVCKQLKKDMGFNDIVESIDALSGATILLLGIKGVSGDVSAFLNALTIKDQIINIGKCVLDKIISKKTSDCDKRMNLMQWAYSVIYYTAYFDVLDEKMPKYIRKRIELSFKEKTDIFQNAKMEKGEGVVNDAEICFPHEVYNYAKIEEELRNLYGSMSVGLKKFVHMLSFEEECDGKQMEEFNEVVNKLPELAIERFKAQYIYLASNFNEFYVLMQIENYNSQNMVVEEAYKEIVSVSYETKSEMDVGLKKLEKMVINLPETIREEKVNDIVEKLIDEYKREIRKPIIETKDKDEKLQYPSIEEAFIPQSYKELIYSGKEQLEKEETWHAIDPHEDMDSFWVKYCVSPYSLENLVLILGEPGGGKSLLTKILCARMIDTNNIFIRIPLREVDVEKDIEEIVCDRISKDGDCVEQITTFRWFAENFKKHPITLIFDGYDEVLQATGKVYRNLLQKILKFQAVCQERHRPVRIIVTSRKTLIDKADIPLGTVVLKLMEFNELQRNEWIHIWNQKNSEVFQEGSIKSFHLPENNSNIDELSKQPLLLLMLAIYDADFENHINSLADNVALNRTKLYNELLERFVRRELKKGARGTEVSYDEASPKDQQEMVDVEMERLGIAALGMFNRGKLSLKLEELEKDLAYMEISSPIYEKKGHLLSSAELLVISFLFIHDSKSGTKDSDEEIVAFEFLHKTFYEFLVADLILKYLIREIEELNEMRCSKAKANYQKALDYPERLGLQYYTALMHTSLCKEPEIIQMIVEWKKELIRKNFGDKYEEYDITIEELLQKQISMVCNNNLMVSYWTGNTYDELSSKSYLYYCSTYLMNLLVLQTITKQSQKTIMNITVWKYISQFWKMNIEEEILLKFIAIFNVYKQDEDIVVRRKRTPKIGQQKDKLKNQLEIFNFLQEDIVHDLCMLQCLDIPNNKKQKIREELKRRGLEIAFEIVLGEIHEFVLNKDIRFSLSKNIRKGCQILEQKDIEPSIVLDWMIYINICINTLHIRTYKQAIIQELTEVILRRYSYNFAIVSELFDCLRNAKLERIFLLGRRFSVGNIEYMLHKNPYLIYEYLKLLDETMPMEIVTDRYEEILHLATHQYINDTEIAVKLLKLIHKNSNINSLSKCFEQFRNSLCLEDVSNPKVLVELLRICAIEGESTLINQVLEYQLDTIKNFAYSEPKIFVDVFEILQIVGIKSELFEEEIVHLFKRLDRILNEEPEICVQLLRIFRAGGIKSKWEFLIRKVFENYEMIFNVAPAEAIEFLKMIPSDIMWLEKERALNYSIKYFGFLASKSINSAVEFLSMFEEDIQDFAYCVEIVFNVIFYDNKNVNENELAKLLKCKQRRHKRYLLKYFKTKYKYMEYRFPVIAKIIKELYPKI